MEAAIAAARQEVTGVVFRVPMVDDIVHRLLHYKKGLEAPRAEVDKANTDGLGHGH